MNGEKMNGEKMNGEKMKKMYYKELYIMNIINCKSYIFAMINNYNNFVIVSCV